MSVELLVIWRHGRTAWNATGRFQGQLDPPLDEVGLAQASSSARSLAALSPDLVVASDLRRAADTGRALATVADCPIRFDPRLRETSLGRWEGLTRAEVAERFPAEYESWTSGGTARRGGGETREEVAGRARAVVDELVASSDGSLRTVVVATHGGSALAMTGALAGLPPAHWGALAVLGNCRWAELKRARSGWRVSSYNAVAPEDLEDLPAALDVEPPQVWN